MTHIYLGVSHTCHTSHIWSQTSHIWSQTSHIWSQTSHIWSQTSHIWSQTSHIWSHTPHIWSHTPHIWSHTSILSPDFTSIIRSIMAVRIQLDNTFLPLRDAFQDQPVKTLLVLCTALIDVFAEGFECFALLLLFAHSIRRQRNAGPYGLIGLLKYLHDGRDGTTDTRSGCDDNTSLNHQTEPKGLAVHDDSVWVLGGDDQIERFFFDKGGDRAVTALGAFAQDWKSWDEIFRNLRPVHLRYLLTAILEVKPSDEFKYIQREAKKRSGRSPATTTRFPGLYPRLPPARKPKEKRIGKKRKRIDESTTEPSRESYNGAGLVDSSLDQPAMLAQANMEWVDLLPDAALLGTVIDGNYLENTANMPSCPP
ncbi:Hypothetical protein NCS54_01371400 [Fusarium falciforme]|uniref:Hypothetical protein n=1 Tax=Fusarium falciforme TaxID=195108 RepID=UPI002301281D|nr:Hypothetical protein NCS54_01371400 [Fusarium falciforme]WAO96053.1 Hypothetical protein NCS54_01371400 [Fusarium falciforme]